MFPEVTTVALRNTVIYTALGFGFGLTLAVVLALMRLSSVGVCRALAAVYIEFFRRCSPCWSCRTTALRRYA